MNKKRIKIAESKKLPKEWWQYHHRKCGTIYRGCHPTQCPKDQYEKTGIWNWELVGSHYVEYKEWAKEYKKGLLVPHPFLNYDEAKRFIMGVAKEAWEAARTRFTT